MKSSSTIRAEIEVTIPVFAVSKQLDHLCLPAKHLITVLVKRLFFLAEQAHPKSV